MFETPSGSPSHKVFPTLLERASHSYLEGQHHNSGLYQRLRRNAVPSFEHTGTQTDSVVWSALSVSKGNSHAWDFKLRHRPIVKGFPSLLGMETVQASSGLVMDALWESGHRSFYYKEKYLVPSVISPAQSGSGGVDAQDHPWKRVRLYTFPLLALILPKVASERIRIITHPDNLELAGEALACRDNLIVV